MLGRQQVRLLIATLPAFVNTYSVQCASFYKGTYARYLYNAHDVKGTYTMRTILSPYIYNLSIINVKALTSPYVTLFTLQPTPGRYQNIMAMECISWHRLSFSSQFLSQQLLSKCSSVFVLPHIGPNAVLSRFSVNGNIVCISFQIYQLSDFICFSTVILKVDILTF